MFRASVPFFSNLRVLAVSISLIHLVERTVLNASFAFFCRIFFLFFFSQVSISVSSALFLSINFCVSLCMVSTDSFEILFVFSVVSSSSFKASDPFF